MIAHLFPREPTHTPTMNFGSKGSTKNSDATDAHKSRMQKVHLSTLNNIQHGLLLARRTRQRFPIQQPWAIFSATTSGASFPSPLRLAVNIFLSREDTLCNLYVEFLSLKRGMPSGVNWTAVQCLSFRLCLLRCSFFRFFLVGCDLRDTGKGSMEVFHFIFLQVELVV